MKELCSNLFKLLLIWLLAIFLIASCGRSAYAYSVHQKADELALVGYYSNGAQSERTFFVRNISMRLHVTMAELERDMLACVGIRLSLSTNPFQFCHHNYLVVIGKTSLNSNGVHSHA